MEQPGGPVPGQFESLSARLQECIRHRRQTVARLKDVLIASLDLSLDPNEIDEDEPLFGYGLGLDSIDALQLVLGVEAAYDLSLPPDELMIYRSINTIADYLIDNAAKEIADEGSDTTHAAA